MQIVNSNSPALAYGCAVGINNRLYAHGGLMKRNDSGSVSRSLYKYDVIADRWTNITSPICPALAYHGCFVTENR